MDITNTIVLYHNDLDGIAAAAIFKCMVDPNNDAKYVSIWNTSESNMEYLKEYRNVIILDCGFSDQFMNSLNNFSDIIWIDHHPKSVESELDIPGERSVHESAAILTWKFYNSDVNPPYPIHLIGLVDTGEFFEDKLALSFVYGLNGSELTQQSAIWGHLLSIFHKYHPMISNIVKNGYRIFNNIRKNGIEFLKSHLQKAKIGHYTFLAMNRNNIEHIPVFVNYTFDEYDGIIYYYKDNSLQYRCSMRTNKHTVDLNDLAKMFGGGGHVNAAGFKNEKLPFNPKKLSKNEISDIIMKL